MYSLIALFVSIPLMFSHFFGRLWADFIVENSIGRFESVKMHLFLSLLILATLEMLWMKWDDIIKSLKKYRYIFLGSIGVILFLCIYVYEPANLRDLLLGIGEKQHGLLLPIGLIWLGYLLSFLTTLEQRRILYAILFSGIFISFICILEGVFHYDIFSGLPFVNTGSWWDIRATATLGNPNYVAGYLLMLLPIIVGSIHRREKYILILLIGCGILMTKSLIAISLMMAYFLFLISYRYLWKKIPRVFLILGLIGAFVLYMAPLGSEKWLSFLSRFVIMKYTLIDGISSPIDLLFGHGPDAVMRLFALVRPEEVDQYFPRDSIIDSSHSIFIDTFMNYGLFGLAGSVAYIWRRWDEIISYKKHSIILGLIFLSLNVVVISHLIVLIWLLSDTKKKDKISP